MHNILTTKGEKSGTISKLPLQFNEPMRPDLIKRAVHCFWANNRQKYGTNPRAGLHSSANNRGRRRSFGAWINKGLHRTQRIRIKSGPLSGVVRVVPHSVKGRKAHPPKAEKIWSLKLNKKEHQKAIRSAIAGTINKEYICALENTLTKNLQMPIIVNELSNIKKTKQLMEFLDLIGFGNEINRVKLRKIRAGKGTMRSRKYKTKTGPLIIFGDETADIKTLNSLRGINAVCVRNLNANLLSPGADYIRLCIWSKNALEILEKENLFFNNK